jgi:hypothetical protein
MAKEFRHIAETFHVSFPVLMTCYRFTGKTTRTNLPVFWRFFLFFYQLSFNLEPDLGIIFFFLELAIPSLIILNVWLKNS